MTDPLTPPVSNEADESTAPAESAEPASEQTPPRANGTDDGVQLVAGETADPEPEGEPPLPPIADPDPQTEAEAASEPEPAAEEPTASEPVAEMEVDSVPDSAIVEESEPAEEEPVAEEPTATEPIEETEPEPAVEEPEEPAEPVAAAEPTAAAVEAEEEEPVEAGDAIAEEDGKQWFVLKVTTNRENSIKDNLLWRFKRDGLEEYLGQVVIPSEKVKEKTKSGKTRTVTRKLFPGYMMIQMELNEETWFLVRDTSGVGDFTGAAGKPVPMTEEEVARMLNKPIKPKALPTTQVTGDDGETVEKVVVHVPYNLGETVKIKEGSFAGFEGVVDAIDPATGKTNVLVQILGQATPVELEYYQVETV